MRSIVTLVLSSALLLGLASGCASTAATAPRSNPVVQEYSALGAPGGVQLPKRVTGVHPDREPGDIL